MLADRCGANLPDFQKALWLNMKEFTGLKSQLQRPQSRGPDDTDLLEFCLNRKYEVNNHMGVQESCLEPLGGECGNIGIGGCQAGSQLSNGGVHGVCRPRQGCLGCREASVQRGFSVPCQCTVGFTYSASNHMRASEEEGLSLFIRYRKATKSYRPETTAAQLAPHL